MINGWNIEQSVTKSVEATLLNLDAEPVFAEIGEKVRELTANLHEKILSQELQWSLMMTPLSMVEDLKRMCEGEIARREIEMEALNDKKDKSQEN